MDGSLNKEENGARLILIGPDRKRIEYALRLQFPVTNNVTEYDALILGLELVREVGAEAAKVFSGSQLVGK